MMSHRNLNHPTDTGEVKAEYTMNAFISASTLVNQQLLRACSALQ